MSGRTGEALRAVGLLVVASSCGQKAASVAADASVQGVEASVDAGGCPAGPVESDVPTIPVGLDAYRHWDRWPYLHIGERAYTRSTYDRAGGNEAADSSHYLRLSNDRAIALDVVGTGVLYFTRANHWHGSPWHDVVDGQDHVIAETATTDPNTPVPDASFIPAAAFPAPLAMTWSTTQGSDVSGVPIGFTQSLQIAYERTHYGTGYFSYHLFPSCARNLSAPIETWNEEAPDPAVMSLVAQAGQDIAPPTSAPDVKSMGGTVALQPGTETALFDLAGPMTMRALTFTVAAADAEALGNATLRITWDGRSTPSVDAPMSLFFGAGSMLNRVGREYLVRAFPVSIRFWGGMVTLATYFPMPFQRTAHVVLVGGAAPASVSWSVRAEPYADPPNWAGYLHATYVDQGTPRPGMDLVMLDTTSTEGGGDWCGQIVGTSFVFSDRANLNTLEGDPRFFFDDSQTPQVQGTGTEEWGGGGDYWQGGLQTTLPFFGHPVGAPGPTAVTSPEDAIESAYRFLLADAMPFGKNARIQIEHGGTDDSTEHYRSLVYWYGLPGACLVQTDALHVGDTADEAAHHYASPGAHDNVDTLSTRYEWGVDTIAAPDGGSTVIYPASADTGRHTSRPSEFTLAIRPGNLGVLLRRKLDYGFPDQLAEVYIADGTAATPSFVRAGTWYVAGSNSCFFSDPPGELDPPQTAMQTSDRRWRDDEFLVPRSLTEGRTSLRVRVVPTGTWSEYRYTAYVWTLPPLP